MATISETFESTRPASTRPDLRYSKLHNSSPSVGFSPDTPTPFSDHSTLFQLGGSPEVATPQPAASSEVGGPATPLGVVPERVSAPQPTASLDEMVSEATSPSSDLVSGTQQTLGPSRVSSPSQTGNSSGASTPRPGRSSASPYFPSVGAAMSSDEPLRTPSPLTPTRSPVPTPSPPGERR